MATQEKIDELTAVIQACLEQKMQDGFDASAALTIDIARQVATEIEAKAADYTDVEIDKIKLLIGDDVDLGPFTEFMTIIKTLLDGDDTADGYQIFNKLVSDTANNATTLLSHTSSIQLITDTLSALQTTITDHEARIAVLEAFDHEHTDCGECQDELLAIIKESQAAACTAASAVIDTYRTSKAALVSKNFADELDPITLTAAATPNVDGFLSVTGTVSGRRVSNVVVVFSDGTNGSALPVDGAYEVISTASETTLTGAVVTAVDSASAAVGVSVSVSHTTAEGGDGAIL